jgi:hypothetical protein
MLWIEDKIYFARISPSGMHCAKRYVILRWSISQRCSILHLYCAKRYESAISLTLDPRFARRILHTYKNLNLIPKMRLLRSIERSEISIKMHFLIASLVPFCISMEMQDLFPSEVLYLHLREALTRYRSFIWKLFFNI